jgi:hypothetical protein
MKTAEEWLEVSKQMALEIEKLPDVFNMKQVVDNKYALKLFKQIQLDAYRAGGLAAAGMCIGYKNHGDTHPPIETRRAILTHFNDPKLEIPE